VAWLKKHEHFRWPSSETGDELRDVLSSLANCLMAEFTAPPKMIVAVQMAALFVSTKHNPGFMSDFHSGLCYQDSDICEFRDNCARGITDDSVLKFIHPSALPGFDRLTGIYSAEN
jgi:hypothetical protein